MTLADWAEVLLADCSDTCLLGFADWLELDQNDETLAAAAKGVRELLVQQGKRPFTDPQACLWFAKTANESHDLPREVFEQLGRYPQVWWWWVDYADNKTLTAENHLTALLDAAQAWVKVYPASDDAALRPPPQA